METRTWLVKKDNTANQILNILLSKPRRVWKNTEVVAQLADVFAPSTVKSVLCELVADGLITRVRWSYYCATPHTTRRAARLAEKQRKQQRPKGRKPHEQRLDRKQGTVVYTCETCCAPFALWNGLIVHMALSHKDTWWQQRVDEGFTKEDIYAIYNDLVWQYNQGLVR